MGATFTLAAVIGAALNGISMIALLGATILGAENYRETSSISNYWLLFTLTAAMGTFLFSLLVLKRFDIFAAAVEELDVPIALAFVIGLIVTSFETLKSDIGVTVR